MAGWDFTAPGGLRGLGRQQERLQRAGATARVRPKEPQEGKGVKAGKSWEEIFLQGESGVRKPRPGLSCPGRLCSLCSHGNRSDALLAWLFSQFIFKGSSCLRRGAFRQTLAGEEQGSAGGTGGKAAAALGEHYLIRTAGEPHKWQHQQTPAPHAGRLWQGGGAPVSAVGHSHSRRSPGVRAGVLRLPLYTEQAKHPLNKKPPLAPA